MRMGRAFLFTVSLLSLLSFSGCQNSTARTTPSAGDTDATGPVDADRVVAEDDLKTDDPNSADDPSAEQDIFDDDLAGDPDQDLSSDEVLSDIDTPVTPTGCSSDPQCYPGICDGATGTCAGRCTQDADCTADQQTCNTALGRCVSTACGQCMSGECCLLNDANRYVCLDRNVCSNICGPGSCPQGYVCSEKTDACILASATCGNSVVDPGEACELGQQYDCKEFYGAGLEGVAYCATDCLSFDQATCTRSDCPLSGETCIPFIKECCPGPYLCMRAGDGSFECTPTK
ncbi:MAG TPA: hypothetical protein PLV42_04905 [bacterium]|nr:hypothetical protein [bacterium]